MEGLNRKIIPRITCKHCAYGNFSVFHKIDNDCLGCIGQLKDLITNEDKEIDRLMIAINQRKEHRRFLQSKLPKGYKKSV